MKFFVGAPYISHEKTIEINAKKFYQIEFARTCLLQFMDFQEQVQQLILRLRDLEQFLLNCALNDLLIDHADYDHFQTMRLEANNLVSSYLNTMAAIRDQATNIEAPKGQHKFREAFRNEWDVKKETSIEFRLALRFRVHAQHVNKPVSGVTLGAKWDTNRTRCESHATIRANIHDICKHRDIKKSEKTQYCKHFGDEIDIAHLLRATTSQITEIVKNSIQVIEPVIKECMKHLNNAYKDYEDLEANHHEYCSMDASGQIEDRFVIFMNFIKRAEKLLAIKLLSNYQLHYVSNRARGHENAPEPNTKFE